MCFYVRRNTDYQRQRFNRCCVWADAIFISTSCFCFSIYQNWWNFIQIQNCFSKIPVLFSSLKCFLWRWKWWIFPQMIRRWNNWALLYFLPLRRKSKPKIWSILFHQFNFSIIFSKLKHFPIYWNINTYHDVQLKWLYLIIFSIEFPCIFRCWVYCQ